MLHEVLLALSGHPTPLFGDQGVAFAEDAASQVTLLSPSEKSLLQSVGELSALHLKLKGHLESITPRHSSIICRAVAKSIQNTHLARFQERIVDVERKILQRDASVVGAYNIVPLASVVGEFQEWHRRMAWFWDIACFISSPKGAESDGSSQSGSTGARLIDKLRDETHTGYTDIETAAIELSRVAETVWLRQLSSWALYGTLPAFGEHDFFIRAEPSDEKGFVRVVELTPSFITSETANAIMFAGRSIHHVANHQRELASSSSSLGGLWSDSELPQSHMELLASLSLPIIPTQLSATISTIRESVSRHALQRLLPKEMTLKVLSCLREFLLLQRSGFAATLLTEADKKMQKRQQNMGHLLQSDPAKAMEHLSIKDTELIQILHQTWKSLRIEGGDDDDELLEYAQKHVSLVSGKSLRLSPLISSITNGANPEISDVAFDDAVFPTATRLTFQIASPINLVLSSADVEIYSAINAYLLALQRSLAKLRDLWRRTQARRDSRSSRSMRAEERERNQKRSAALRKVWATCSAANFLLSETVGFFEGEVIQGSCRCFREWIESGSAGTTPDAADAGDRASRDPETLAVSHRRFLAALAYALLLTDEPYTRALRSLLHNVDNLIAFFARLLDTQHRHDLEHEAAGSAHFARAAEDEHTVALNLDRARKKVDSDLRSVVNRLMQLDRERIGSLRYLDLALGSQGDFEPWKGGGLERLLMKLEFGRLTIADNEPI